MIVACNICGALFQSRPVSLSDYGQTLEWKGLADEMYAHLVAQHQEGRRAVVMSTILAHWLASLCFSSPDDKFADRQEAARQTIADIVALPAAEVVQRLRIAPTLPGPPSSPC